MEEGKRKEGKEERNSLSAWSQPSLSLPVVCTSEVLLLHVKRIQNLFPECEMKRRFLFSAVADEACRQLLCSACCTS